MGGQLDASAQIVTRYQSLVCSLAYSATGSLSQSEDLAQETFIAAWKGLGTLREPEKLRSWLCAIARNIIAGALRNRKREPSNTTESLEALRDLPSRESLPVDSAISREEESILWRSLEHIPDIYRETLVLFYREGQSVADVAQVLELSEEAVKSRLSRGRKLLKMEVESFVENALRQSAPGWKFTAAVVAGLPALTLPASASSILAASSRGLVTAKTGSISSFIGMILFPIISVFGVIVYLTGYFKGELSRREKALAVKWIASVVCVVALVAAVISLHATGFLSFAIAVAISIFLVVCFAIATTFFKSLRKSIRIEEGRVQGGYDTQYPFGHPETKGYTWTLYGWLIIVNFCNPFAALTVNASKAQDAITVFTILAILAAAFLISRGIAVRKPEKALTALYAIMISQFPLMMSVLLLRWQKWTGQPPWQMEGYDLILPVVGFFLFSFAIIHRLLKRNR